MSQKGKGLRHTRSDKDESLYKFTYYNFDPSEVSSVRLLIGIGVALLKGAKIGQIFVNNLVEEEGQNSKEIKSVDITIPFAGTVLQIFPIFQKDNQIQAKQSSFYNIKMPTKKGHQPFFTFKICEHQPRTQTFLDDLDIKTIKKPTSLVSLHKYEICQFCQEILWIYYEKESISIPMYQFLPNFEDFSQEDLSSLEWQIVLNEHFTKSTLIAKINHKEINIQLCGKAIFLHDFSSKARPYAKDFIVMKIKKTICKHEKIKEGKCQYCLQEVDGCFTQNDKNYLFQMEHEKVINPTITRGKALAHQEQQFISKLLQQRKAIIILDLDNTILHSLELSELELSTILEIKQFYLILKYEFFPEGNRIKKDFLVIKMRPYFREFIFEVCQFYQIYVYTKGTRIYAQQICKYIRAQYAGQQFNYPMKTWEKQQVQFMKNSQSFKSHRIISRNQDPNLEKKSLDNILPTKKQYHLILDDRRDVWDNSNSWFYTRDYFFFLKNQKHPDYYLEPNHSHQPIPSHQPVLSHQPVPSINEHDFRQKFVEQFKHSKASNIEGTLKNYTIVPNQQKDYFLIFAAHALKIIHLRFFEALQGQNEKKQRSKPLSISLMLHKYKHTFMSKFKIKFLIQNCQNSNTYRRALKMGAIIVKSQSTQIPHFIIRANLLTNGSKILEKKSGQVTQKMEERGFVASKMEEGVNGVLNGDEQQESERIEKGSIELIKKIKLYSQTMQIAFVSQNWINACYEYAFVFDYEKFIIDDPLAPDVTQNYQEIIAQNAMAIYKEIEHRRTHLNL